LRGLPHRFTSRHTLRVRTACLKAGQIEDYLWHQGADAEIDLRCRWNFGGKFSVLPRITSFLRTGVERLPKRFIWSWYTQSLVSKGIH
jgi:hypothetical protein